MGETSDEAHNRRRPDGSDGRAGLGKRVNWRLECYCVRKETIVVVWCSRARLVTTREERGRTPIPTIGGKPTSFVTPNWFEPAGILQSLDENLQIFTTFYSLLQYFTDF